MWGVHSGLSGIDKKLPRVRTSKRKDGMLPRVSTSKRNKGTTCNGLTVFPEEFLEISFVPLEFLEISFIPDDETLRTRIHLVKLQQRQATDRNEEKKKRKKTSGHTYI
jgi:hypothetical protein